MTKYNRFLLLTTVFSLPFSIANANYTLPSQTLGNDSAYTLHLSVGDENDYDFIYYKVVGEKAVPVYYKYTNPLDSIKDTAINTGRKLNWAGDGSITHFFNNSGQTSGNAIFNNNVAGGDIVGDFIYNVAPSTAGEIWGVAIRNVNANAVINSIKGDFIGNYTNAKTNVLGGAIYNQNNAKINSIEGNFIGNQLIGSNVNYSFVYGAAILNADGASIGDIKGDFVANKVFSPGNNAYGGAIYNAALYGSNGASIGDIQGNFIANSAETTGSSTSGYALGGAIYLNASTIGTISNGVDNGNIKNSQFIGNYVKATAARASGGAINNYGTITAIYGDFIGNSAYSRDYFAFGGALANQGTISTLVGNFIGNVSHSDNYYSYGAALYNSASTGGIGYLQANFIGNKTISTNSNAIGGAVATYSTLTFTNSNFINNTAEGVEAYGGAIFSGANIKIVADNGTSLFSGNKSNDESSAIFMNDASTTLTLEAVNNGVITFDDAISGVDNYTILLTGDDSGEINLNSNIYDGIIVSGDTGSGGYTTTNVKSSELLNNNNSLVMNYGTINIADMGLTRLQFNDMQLLGGTINVATTDVDLKNQEMGGISSSTYTDGSTVINVENLNILTDTKSSIVNVNFIDAIAGNRVSNHITDAYGPIYGYNVDYDPMSGDYVFIRNGRFNPSNNANAVSAIAAASVLSDEIYSRVLVDVDDLYNRNDRIVCNRDVARTWVKTFGADENIDLKNVGNVDSKFAGIIGGIESGRISEGKGISAVYNAYAAYAYGEQGFSHEKIKQHAGYVGVGATFYKDNYFVAGTTNVGVIKNKAEDNFNSYLGGVGIKLGYNHYLTKEYVLQPNFYASYTYIKSNDYKTSKNVKVKYDDMHNFEVAPGLKLVRYFDDDMRAYIKTRYVFNFNEGQDAYANSVLLPEVKIKDYVEYGLGLEKIWLGYDLTSFAEFNRRDGGREGWTGIIGVKWKF